MGNSHSSDDQIFKNVNPLIDSANNGFAYSISTIYEDKSHYDREIVCEMIKGGKLCPFYPEAQETQDEECPICFLEFIDYNRTNCCKSRICTDCFIQLKPMEHKDEIGCPFCNTKPFTVVYKSMPVTFTQIRSTYLQKLELKEIKKLQKDKQLNYQMNMLNQMSMLRDLSTRADSPQDLEALMMRMAIEESLSNSRKPDESFSNSRNQEGLSNK